MRACALVVVSLVLSAASRASDSCGAELKLQLVPGQAQAAVVSLKAFGEDHNRIYFYDTPQLSLLAKGLILRIRQGANNDLVVKLRPDSEKQFSDRTMQKKGFKCESEINAGVASPSFSTTRKLNQSSVPQTGEELEPLLTKGQRELLQDAGIVVDWAQVRRIVDIESTIWTVPSPSRPLTGLSLEFWKWKNGTSLELSTKSSADGATAALDELKSMLQQNHLDLNSVQQPKTTTALKSVAK